MVSVLATYIWNRGLINNSYNRVLGWELEPRVLPLESPVETERIRHIKHLQPFLFWIGGQLTVNRKLCSTLQNSVITSSLALIVTCGAKFKIQYRPCLGLAGVCTCCLLAGWLNINTRVGSDVVGGDRIIYVDCTGKLRGDGSDETSQATDSICPARSGEQCRCRI